MPDPELDIVVKGTYLVDNLSVPPIKIAKWIIDEKLEIIGFWKDSEIKQTGLNIYIRTAGAETAAELGDKKFHEIRSLYIFKLQSALWALREEMERVETPDLEKTDNAEQHISNILRSLIFDGNSFKSVINETTPPNLISGGDKENTTPMDNDGKGSAKNEILSYAKNRYKNGNPLVRADFSSDTDATISAISKNNNVNPDTLRKYVQDASLLEPTKTGRKPKA